MKNSSIARLLSLGVVCTCLCASLLTSRANASGVNFLAFGDQMAGGTLTIHWTPGPGAPVIIVTAPIFAAGPGHGRAIVPDPFGNPFPGAFFDVIGDTNIADWRLENLADASIVQATFDLRGTLSLFDDDSLPSTAGSSSGLDNVLYNAVLSSAPMELRADEVDPWMDGKNMGDMFHGESIFWPFPTPNDLFFSVGEVYVWNDDTDVIPAPTALSVLGIAGLLASRRRR